MKDKALVTIVAIPSIALMVLGAMSLGYNGYVFTTGIAAITLIVGYFYGKGNKEGTGDPGTQGTFGSAEEYWAWLHTIQQEFEGGFVCDDELDSFGPRKA